MSREQKDHVTDCYFCITNTNEFSHKIRKNILYPSLPCAIHPVAHSDELLISKPPVTLPKPLEKSPESSCVSKFEDKLNTNCPHLITKPKLNDLVCDLNLTMSKSELLKSQLQQRNLLAT